MPSFANIDGLTLTKCELHVPNVGPWWADVWFETAPDVPESITLSVGDLSLVGTIRFGGVFAAQRRARVVAGAGGWGSLISAQHYHNDSGIRARTVVDDAARLAGESIGTFNVVSVNVGIDYVRGSGLASRSLEDAIGGIPWHVDYSGATNIGARDSLAVDERLYQVLDFDAQNKTAVLAMDSLSSVMVGSILAEGLEEPETVREIRIVVDGQSSRVHAWFGGTDSARGRLANALGGIIKRANGDKLFGLYEFRVVAMSGDRVELQPVESAAGMPDLIPVSMKPGQPGSHSALVGGSIVLCQFVNGDRTRPVITSFAGKDTVGHEVTDTEISVSNKIRLGGPGANSPVALAPPVDDSFNNIANAIDSLVNAVIVPNDGGEAMQLALAATWVSPGASDTGADKVDAE